MIQKFVEILTIPKVSRVLDDVKSRLVEISKIQEILKILSKIKSLFVLGF